VTGRQRIEASVHGDVQGVGFRWFVRRQAASLALDGWVANAPDGSVRVVAEGPAAAIDELLVVLRQGPPAARVDRVEVQRTSSTGRLHGFEIRAGAHRGD
jgi:acylphosphatase